jgi:D-glycero-D-manno-heptose 1,7-bisphosphate phosphatase
MMAEKLVCIDRDNTLIKDSGFFGRDIHWRSQLEFYPESISALRLLRKNHIKIAIISNQAGVALGYFDEERVKEINKEIARELKLAHTKVDNWQYCPYVDEEYLIKKEINPEGNKYVNNEIAAKMRKPAAGMVEKAIEELGLKKPKIYFIGDKMEDVLTGQNAGGIGILVSDRDNDEERFRVLTLKGAYYITEGLDCAAKFVVRQ